MAGGAWKLSEEEILEIIKASADAPERKGASGKTDGWGIQRTFDRDLGGAQRAVVKAPEQRAKAGSGPAFDQGMAEKYTG